MNEEVWNRIKAIDGYIKSLRRDISITSSEQDAAATMQERWGVDTDPCIAQIASTANIPPIFYYRSDQWITQPIDLPDVGIFAYNGPLNDAPLEYYGPGMYIIDAKVTKLHRKICGTATLSQSRHNRRLL